MCNPTSGGKEREENSNQCPDKGIYYTNERPYKNRSDHGMDVISHLWLIEMVRELQIELITSER